MIFDTAPLLRDLEQLERQLAELPNHLRALSAAMDRQDAADTLCTNLDVERHLRAMGRTADQLTAHVVGFDGMDAAPTSLSELVLRAIRLAVLAELDSLREVALPPTSNLWAHVLVTIDDLRDAIATATATWSAHRGDRAAYRAALRAAHVGRRRLVEPTGPGRFLVEAQARDDLPELREVSTRLVRLLGLRLDVDADAPLLIQKLDVPAVPRGETAVNGSDSVGSPPMASHEPQDAPRDARGAAIDELARVSLVLATAIAQLDYMSAAWGRRELVAALAQAERLAAPGDGAAPCDDFLRRLAELRTSAEQLLAIAPQPSPATLAATATGDMRAWDEEARRWSAARTATNAAPLGVPRRRYRRNTRPDSPKALREAPGEAADEAADGEAVPDTPSPSDLEGPR